MNRRQFFMTSTVAASTALVSSGGCSRRPSTATNAPIFHDQLQARRELYAKLQAARVSAQTVLETPKPAFDLLSVAPELKGLFKQTIRLHPRVSGEPNPDDSHLGGAFAWPQDEPWPTVPGTEQPLMPILQLRSEDAPARLTYRPGTDLLQLFWNPRRASPTAAAALNPVIIWRKRSDVQPPYSTHPLSPVARGELPKPESLANGVSLDSVPVPCAFFPERVLELPSWDVLPKPMKDKLTAWKPGAEAIYRDQLSTAPGTKIGGYAPPLRSGQTPTCATCNWGMDYFATIAAEEWTEANAIRWKPTNAEGQHRTPTGTTTTTHLHICYRCETWPIAATS